MGREPQGFRPLRSLGESVHKTTVEGVSSSRGIAYPHGRSRNPVLIPGPEGYTPFRTQLDDNPSPRDPLQLPGCHYGIFESGETSSLLIARQEHINERQ